MRATQPHPTRPARQLVPAVALAAALVFSACSSSEDDAGAEASAGETSEGARPATRDEALAFCRASADLQASLAALAEPGDFDASFAAATESVESWSAAVPAELDGLAAPVLTGWQDVVATYDDGGDPAATGAALGELTSSSAFQTALAEFDRFGAENCVPDTTVDDTSESAEAPPATDPPPTTAETVPATPPATSPETTTPPPTTQADGPVAYVGTGGVANAAGLSFTAEQCAFPAGELLGADEPDHWVAVGVVGPELYLAGQDGAEETGLVKYRLEDDPACRLQPAEGFGTGGVLTFDDPIDHVSASPTGTLLASNAIFGTWVVDGPTGSQLACPRGSIAEISPDGTVGYGFFPGSGDLRRYDIGAECATTEAAVTVASQSNPSAGGWIDDSLFVVGGFLAEGGAGVTALDRAGNELWTVGGSPGDLGDLGYGAVSAVSPCGGRVCVVDSNFRTLHILDTATGEQLGLIDLQELVGLRINWFNGLAEDASSSTLWLVGGLSQQTASGERTEQVQGLVYRITLG